MAHAVLLTAGAERDLDAIHDYVAEHDGPAAADRLLRRLLESGAKLAENPERGSRPRELLALGIREYRQILVKPYRLIHRVIGRQVVAASSRTAAATSNRSSPAACSRRSEPEPGLKSSRDRYKPGGPVRGRGRPCGPRLSPSNSLCMFCA